MALVHGVERGLDGVSSVAERGSAGFGVGEAFRQAALYPQVVRGCG
ncbi:hypothetical protein [Mucisphaera sp.]